MEKNLKNGILYGVGVGPGDPELITLKAKSILEKCRVIACPDTGAGALVALKIVSGVVDMSEKEILPLILPMGQPEEKRWEMYLEAANKVAVPLSKGEDVALINLGDVSIYSTFSNVQQQVMNLGYETRMIPGVPSFVASACALNISLAEGKEPLHIFPGGGDMEEELLAKGTKVIMKSGKKLTRVIAELRERNMLKNAGIVKNCSMEDEELYPHLEGEIPEIDSYFTTLIVKEKK